MKNNKNKLLVSLLTVASLTSVVGLTSCDEEKKEDPAVVEKQQNEAIYKLAWDKIDSALTDQVKTSNSTRTVKLPASVVVFENNKKYEFTLDYIFSDKYQPEETKNFPGYVQPEYVAKDSEELEEPTRTVKLVAPIEQQDSKITYLTFKGKAVLKKDGVKVSTKMYDFNCGLVKYVPVAKMSDQKIVKDTPVVTYGYYVGAFKYGFVADGDAGLTLFNPTFANKDLQKATFDKPVLVKITGNKDMYSGLVQLKGAFVEPITEDQIPAGQLPKSPEKLDITIENLKKLTYKDEGRKFTVTGKITNFIDYQKLEDEKERKDWVDFYIRLDDTHVGEGEKIVYTNTFFLHAEKRNYKNVKDYEKLLTLKENSYVTVEGWTSFYKSTFQGFPVKVTVAQEPAKQASEAKTEGSQAATTTPAESTTTNK